MEAQDINSEYWLARLQHIFKEIEGFCQTSLRNAVDIELVLDAKGFKVEEIEKILDLGIRRLRVNENNFKQIGLLKRGKIHFDGDLKSFDWKFFKDIDLWENLQSLEEAEKVNEFLIKNEIILKVLLRIDFQGEHGFEPKKLFMQMKELGKFKNLKISGISLDNKGCSEENFHKLRAVFTLLRRKYKGFEWLEAGDVECLKMAIQYGAHLIALKRESFN